MTENEKQQIKQEVLDEIKAESTDVTQLEEATSLENVNSLPAMQGAKLVSVPLTLITSPMQSAVTMQRYKGVDEASSAMTDPMILLGTFKPQEGESTADFTARVNAAINSTYSTANGAANEKYCGVMRLIVNSQNIELRQYVKSYANGQYVQMISGTVGLGTTGQIVFSQMGYAVYWRTIDQGVAGQWQPYAASEATETQAGLLSTADKKKLNLMSVYEQEGTKNLQVPGTLMTGDIKTDQTLTFGEDLGNISCIEGNIMTLEAGTDTLQIGGDTTAAYNNVTVAGGKLHIAKGIEFNDIGGATDGKISWNTDGLNLSVGSSRNITIGDKTKVNIAVSQTEIKIKDGSTNDDLVIIDHSDMPEDHTDAVRGQVTLSDLSCRLFSLGKINKSYYAMEYPAFGATAADCVGFNAPIIVGRDGYVGIQFSNADEYDLYSMGMSMDGSTDTDLTISNIGGDLQIRMSEENQHIKLYSYGGTLTLTDANTKINNELDVEIAGKNILKATQNNIALNATNINLTGITHISGQTTLAGQTIINGDLHSNGVLNLGTTIGNSTIKGDGTTISGETRISLDSATVNIGQAGGETYVKSPLYCHNSLTLMPGSNLYIGSTGFVVAEDKIERPSGTGGFLIKADTLQMTAEDCNITIGTTGFCINGISLVANPTDNTLTITNIANGKTTTLQLL